MAADIEGDVVRIEAALNTPTLKLLDRKSAGLALPLFATLFPAGKAAPVPLERFHTRVEALLTQLHTAGYDTPPIDGKRLAKQWVRERWLIRDPGRDEETYRLTGDAEQALEYVTRATRSSPNVSRSRVETMRRVIAEAALAAHPDREERKRRLAEEISALQAEYDRIDGGGDLADVSDAELAERFANVLRELDGLPSDFRRVEEAVRGMHRTIIRRFRDEDRPMGDVVDDYLAQAETLLTATPEGRAFAGALDLLGKRDWMSRLHADLETILNHPAAATLPPEAVGQLRTAVDVIRRGIADVLDQRKRLSATLREHIENYDHVGNRELERVLHGIDRELRIWMQSARARDHVHGLELLPARLDVPALKLNMFDPASERAPAPLDDVSDQAPAAPTLEDIRRAGGPSLEQLRRHLDGELDAAGAAAAADLFNGLPDELRRPVEVFGLLQLFTQRGAALDVDAARPVSAMRPDGTIRELLVPDAALTGPTTEEGHRP